MMVAACPFPTSALPALGPVMAAFGADQQARKISLFLFKFKIICLKLKNFKLKKLDLKNVLMKIARI
jgi:hypothetical protein